MCHKYVSGRDAVGIIGTVIYLMGSRTLSVRQARVGGKSQTSHDPPRPMYNNHELNSFKLSGHFPPLFPVEMSLPTLVPPQANQVAATQYICVITGYLVPLLIRARGSG